MNDAGTPPELPGGRSRRAGPARRVDPTGRASARPTPPSFAPQNPTTPPAPYVDDTVTVVPGRTVPGQVPPPTPRGPAAPRAQARPTAPRAQVQAAAPRAHVRPATPRALPGPLPGALPQAAGPRGPRAPRRRRRVFALVAGGVTLLLGAGAAFAAYTYLDLSNGIHRSSISAVAGLAGSGVAQHSGETNILVMGLDSRLDENGNPLPATVYNALQAGNQSDGGYNTNVLMLIHLSANGGRAVGISIPRDDYVALAGRPDGTSMAKIKEAYGLTLDQKLRQLVGAGGISHAVAYQQARAAARQAEITTVSTFLGGVTINHFVEVTMAAFYQVAVAVQPITVCLDEATSDPFSGASFPAGVQQISASQAVSFVRQRRDNAHPGLDFTDLDRERRQQAFIISLAYKLKQAGTFTNLGTLQTLIDTAKQNIALDSGFNLLGFAGQASTLAGGNISFTTLPITGFGVRNGQDVNVVNLDQVRALAAQLLSDAPATPPAPARGTASTGATSVGKAPTGATSVGKAPTGATSSGKASAAVRSTTSSSATQNLGALAPTPLQSSSIPCVK